MNIAIVVNSINRGGAGRQACELASYFADNNHTVTLIPINGITTHGNYTVDDRVELMHLDHAPTDVHPQRLLGRLLNFVRMRRLLSNTCTDVVFAFLPYGIMLTLFAAIGKSLPVVACERSYPLARISSEKNLFRRMALRFFYRVLIAHSDVITGQTQATVEWLKSMAPKTRTIIIPNALAEDVSEPVTEPTLANTKMLLTVGRFIPQKRFDILIDAFIEVWNDYKDWQLVLIGDGPEWGRLASMVPEALRENVFFLGHQGELANWYSRAEIFILPSEMEGFPNVLIEAMAMNTACIAFDIKSGPKEILKDGRAGVLLSNEQPKERLAEELRILMANPSKREVLKRQGLYVRAAFDREKVYASWVTLAKQLVLKE